MEGGGLQAPQAGHRQHRGADDGGAQDGAPAGEPPDAAELLPGGGRGGLARQAAAGAGQRRRHPRRQHPLPARRDRVPGGAVRGREEEEARLHHGVRVPVPEQHGEGPLTAELGDAAGDAGEGGGGGGGAAGDGGGGGGAGTGQGDPAGRLLPAADRPAGRGADGRPHGVPPHGPDAAPAGAGVRGAPRDGLRARAVPDALRAHGGPEAANALLQRAPLRGPEEVLQGQGPRDRVGGVVQPGPGQPLGRVVPGLAEQDAAAEAKREAGRELPELPGEHRAGRVRPRRDGAHGAVRPVLPGRDGGGRPGDQAGAGRGAEHGRPEVHPERQARGQELRRARRPPRGVRRLHLREAAAGPGLDRAARRAVPEVPAGHLHRHAVVRPVHPPVRQGVRGLRGAPLDQRVAGRRHQVRAVVRCRAPDVPVGPRGVVVVGPGAPGGVPVRVLRGGAR